MKPDTLTTSYSNGSYAPLLDHDFGSGGGDGSHWGGVPWIWIQYGLVGDEVSRV